MSGIEQCIGIEDNRLSKQPLVYVFKAKQSLFKVNFSSQDSVSTFLITLGNQGSVVKVDTRAGVLPVASYHLLDKSHAKSISCHPLQPHLLLTGTNKGGCSIFDLRSSPGREGLLVPATSLLGATRFGILGQCSAFSIPLPGLSPPASSHQLVLKW